jgi:hypothetical protein
MIVPCMVKSWVVRFGAHHLQVRIGELSRMTMASSPPMEKKPNEAI